MNKEQIDQRVAGLSPAKQALLELRRRARGESVIPPIAPAARGEEIPLSFAQEVLWLLDQMAPGNVAYNVPRAMLLRGPLDRSKLQRSLEALVERHESLRTNFVAHDGVPRQVIPAQREVPLKTVDLRSLSEEERQAESSRWIDQESRRPFDLTGDLLLRATLLELSDREHLLIVVIHHIVSDGWSKGVFFRDLAAIYEALVDGRSPSLPPLPVQYADYAIWQREWLEGEALAGQIDYWREQLKDLPEILELPTDHTRPPIQTYNGAHYSFAIRSDLFDRLKSISRQEGTTLFMTTLAAFQTLLHRYSGSDDIVVGSPVAGRTRPEIEGLIGYFLNMLALRGRFSDTVTFRQLLRTTRETALGAYAHQEIPFDKVVAELKMRRSPSYTPLFQTIFSYETEAERHQTMEFGGLAVEQLGFDTHTAKFDLTLSLAEKGSELHGSLGYNSDLFDERTIVQIVEHFKTLLERLVVEPDMPLARIDLMSDEERRRIIVDWNDTGVTYPHHGGVHTLFEQQAAQTPGLIAVVDEHTQLSYRELNERANALAHMLRDNGVMPDTLVGICMERSVGMVVAILGVLKSGGAYVPLDPEYPEKRLEYMIADAGVKVVLTEERFRLRLPVDRVIALDSGEDPLSSKVENPSPVMMGANLAYMIYTSGSTGRPKGAMNTHEAISNRILWMQDRYRLDQDDRVLQKTPFSFDVSVWEFLWPLSTGARLVMARPGGHRDSRYLVDLISNEAITTLHFVPSMLDLFLQEPDIERCSSLRHVICSGEALHQETVDRFLRRLDARLHNLYGPTEAAIDVSFWECVRDDQGRSVPIGRPIANTQLYVLDRNLRPAPVGVPGELHIGGINLARGYHNNPALTGERFIPDPFGNAAGSRLYRTGDRARYLSDGAIEFLGRIDNQVKLRGFRIELGEIESLLREHPLVDECAVVLRGDDAESRLVGYLVARGDRPESGELRRFLRERLPDYMIPASWVMLESLPLSPNGKLDRTALPAPGGDTDRTDEFLSPRTATEEIVAGVWAERLKLDRVSLDDNFFEIGGHSLLGTRVVASLSSIFKVDLPLVALFELPTVAGLSERIDRLVQEGRGRRINPIVPVSGKEKRPLSFAQQRLWLVYQMDPQSPAYNVPLAARLMGKLDVEALRNSLNRIVERHEVLRTHFAVEGGMPLQVVTPLHLELPLTDLSDLPAEEREQELQRRVPEEARRPFDLERGPVVRAELVKLGEEDHVLMLTMHHIASDGWSRGVLFRELQQWYRHFSLANAGEEDPGGEVPGVLPVQYGDYAEWQREWLSGEELDRQLGYWRTQLEDIPTLQLATDFPRPAFQSFNGSWEQFTLDSETAEGLRRVAQQEGGTLFMVLLAAFQTLLHRYSGQSDIVVGTPIANRGSSELEGLIGFFVNTLVMRTDVSGDPRFREVVGRVREVALGAYGHQDIPFEKLVEELQPERDPSRNPFFQVLFALQNVERVRLDFHALPAKGLPIRTRSTRFDLEVFVWEEGEGLMVSIQYNTDLFRGETIERMMQHLGRLLADAAAHPDARLSQLQMLSSEELAELADWNQTSSSYPQESLQELFEQMVARAPEAVAVVGDGVQISYRELNRRANQVGHYLRRRGVGVETLVGISMERSIEMVVAMVGIVKAGGAYLPLDAGYPAERLALMQRDARTPLVLSDGRERKKSMEDKSTVAGEDLPEWIDMIGSWEEIARESEENPERVATSDNLAYVIYTSGSTGVPKGVAVEQRAVVRLVRNTNYVALSAEDVIAQVSTSSFDAATFEIWGALLNGARMVVVEREVLLWPEEFVRTLREERVTTLWLTNALFNRVAHAVPDAYAGIRQVLTGGEAVDVGWAQRVLRDGPPGRLLNGYGPTETTTFATWHHIDRVDEGTISIPIGLPLANSQVYILDRWMQLLPVGVIGEIYIGGDGLARGYLNDAALSAERFLPNPYSETPGGRLYRTKDLGRRRPDGAIEYIGRVDDQVKLRGFRVEPGEIESLLYQHPDVANAAVIVREDSPGDPRLVAYVVPQVESEGEEEQLTSHWQMLYEETYGENIEGSPRSEEPDPGFNIVGWRSSYTGEAIPPSEMKEWVDETSRRILDLKPKRVLEIGCGTGLLLFRIAPGCSHYLGTDFSAVALRDIRPHLGSLPQVDLAQKSADDFQGIEPGRFDTVIVNSVVQYFPGVDYLLRVIRDAVDIVSPGGKVFLGDIRDLRLLRAFHASLLFHGGESAMTTEQMTRRVERQAAAEEELVIDPAFFVALGHECPRISSVEILVKRGGSLNELTKFRYDVVLHIEGEDAGDDSAVDDPLELDWKRDIQSIGALQELLEQGEAPSMLVRNIPNSRLDTERLLLERMTSRGITLGEIRAELAGTGAEEGVDPEDLWRLEENSSYSVAIVPGNGDDPTGCNAFFVRKELVSDKRIPYAIDRVVQERRAWSSYATNPIQEKIVARFMQRTVPQLRNWLQQKLPDYMIPAAFVPMESLPLTLNGKLDRAALPSPDQYGGPGDDFVAPTSPLEMLIAEVWSEVLGVAQVGLNDNFFEIGGHSLMAMQVIARLRELFQVQLPLRILFETPTIGGMVDSMLEDPQKKVAIEKTARLLMQLSQLSDEEVDQMLAGKLQTVHNSAL